MRLLGETESEMLYVSPFRTLGRVDQPFLRRSSTSFQGGMPLAASDCSTQKAPTAAAKVIASRGGYPLSRAPMNPAMVLSPAPVVPITFT